MALEEKTFELLPLEDVYTNLLENHIARAKNIDWTYSDYLPLEESWANKRRDKPLSEPTYFAVLIALLTEVNLPWYVGALMKGAGSSKSLQGFLHQWASEEDQHSLLLETFLLITDNGDHAERSRMRKEMIVRGWENTTEGPFEGVVYTSLQEMYTRAFYLRVAEVCKDESPRLARALRRIAKDETLHMAFYREMVKAHLAVEPDYILPLVKAIMEFEMPNSVMPTYKKDSLYLAQHGITGLKEYYNDVLMQLWRYWGLDQFVPRLPEEVRQELNTYLNRLRKAIVLQDKMRKRG